MLFRDEKTLILHPGKCGGTTIEHLFLRALRNLDLTTLLNRSCFKPEQNLSLSNECLQKRIDWMTGYLTQSNAVNGVSGIYLQHADVIANIKIHGRSYTDSLFKIAFIRNPFPRILSAYYYNMLDRKFAFRTFVLQHLSGRIGRNRTFTVNHFGELNKYTHLDGAVYVDFIGRLEQIDADVSRLSTHMGLRLDLDREHQHAKTVASSLYSHYSEAYDDEMVETVYRLYCRDFELFNYRFERELPYRPAEEKNTGQNGQDNRRIQIKIYGERNSGTRYLTSLIRRNLVADLLPGVLQRKQMSDIDPAVLRALARQRQLPEREVIADLYFEQMGSMNLGWKHTLVDPVEVVQESGTFEFKVLFVTLTKNPYSWLLSFYRRPYHQYWRRKPDFETFLTTPWRTVGRENAPRAFTSPVDLWNKKNEAYLQLGRQTGVLNLKYEDLVANPLRSLKQIVRLASCEWRHDTFINLEHTQRHTDRDYTYYHQYYADERWRDQLSPAATELINKRLDDDVLAAFQYEKLLVRPVQDA